LFFLLFIFTPLSSQAAEIPYPASLSVLVEESPERDGKTFIIQGEVVGEPLIENNGVWLNILEEGNPMAVFCPADLAGTARQLTGGNHERIGTRIQVKGILRRICMEHGGDLDFHAAKCEIIAASKETSDVPKREDSILIISIIWMILVLKIRDYYNTSRLSQ